VSSLDDLAAILKAERLDFVQMAYSIGVRAAEQRLLPVAAERGVAVIVNRPFGSGDHFSRVKGKPLPEWAGEIDCASWAQFMLKYIVGHPAVTCAIPGTGNPKHARDNVGAGLGRLPDDAQRKSMAALWDKL
jgi:diketogulonate reductase-like aldo/keto reductase